MDTKRKYFFTLCLNVLLFVLASSSVAASTVSVVGKAKAINTGNSYLDFTSYNSNVTTDTDTGLFNGYAFAEDLGWVAFGTTDNATGPVTVDLATGEVSGKAKVLSTGELLDFDANNSNVSVNLNNGTFSGFVFSTDIGWYNFSDTGVNTSSVDLDSTPPEAFRLDSPSHQSYTNSSRPTFRWKTATDQVGFIYKYRLEIDNGDTGDFSIDNIAPSGTADLVTNRYTVHYDGFSDTDTTNNYISVTTHSSPEWNDTQNDGNLKEGSRGWTVKAYDTNGNDRSESRTLFVDNTVPTVSGIKINNFSSSTSTYSTRDTTPYITGRVTDTLGGLPKVVSGPQSVEIKIEKRSSFGTYSLHSLVTVNITDLYWSADGKKITQSIDNSSDKYGSFEFTSAPLNAGTYRISISPKDIASNTGNNSIVFITVNGTAFFPTPVEEKEEPIEEAPAIEEPVKQTPAPTPTPTIRPSASPDNTISSSNVFSDMFARIGNWFNASMRWFRNAGHTFMAFFQTSVENDLAFAQNFFEYIRNVTNAAGQMIAGILRTPTMIASRVNTWIAYSIGSFEEIVLNKEPTRITDVAIVEVGPDYAVVEWKTNHYTKNNKINWGETTQYGNHAFSEDFKKDHKVRIEGLNKATAYKFEVMSQNRNYVYDSFHEFVTKPE